ncbi:branched-chain amino acid transport system permease protein [Tardiphaga sp. OK246]|jgi:branched-subunit amino acid ABC-type transport system permease component|uniref:branched-chain amino acid ABC transporter permease n=1 Tax=Tardiphaga sp. OK246 TaxID=1855307 RepID=UPI000B74DC3F|nr:branched-chain amino acid ABC transporter permease [Tardiphaga sp. OK246]SNS93713.1 branched-chain amino acid transport system permease protein [Tardiphaga sp. OK246]
MSLLNLLPHLLNGIALGLLFSLIALGFMLILGLMEQINLAHGSLFALGAYFAYAICGAKLPLPPDVLIAWAGVPLGLRFATAVVVAPILVAPFGLALERLMRRTYGRDPLYGLLLTFGVAMVLEELIRVVWGTRDYMMPVPRDMAGGFIMLDLIWSTYRFWAAGMAIVAMGAVWFIVERTRFGAMVKAGAHDSEIVQALGIDLTRLRVWVFVLGTMLAAFAGVIMAPLWGIRPHMGVDAVVPAFLIIVLGGVGSFWGAALGGLLVGMVVGLSGAYASEWSMLSMYLLLIVVVTLRARGLFGKKSVLEA